MGSSCWRKRERNNESCNFSDQWRERAARTRARVHFQRYRVTGLELRKLFQPSASSNVDRHQVLLPLATRDMPAAQRSACRASKRCCRAMAFKMFTGKIAARTRNAPAQRGAGRRRGLRTSACAPRALGVSSRAPAQGFHSK